MKIVALFHPKIKLFVDGRKETFSVLKNKINRDDKVIWIHVASLGEFEQGLPIIEKLKTEYPSHKILITFFSPSGYEVKKNTNAADCVVYLPMDTKANAKEFISTINPILAIFVKYEIWPNILNVLKENETPTLLISAIFRKNQVFFKWYGAIMKKALKTFDHFFVQDENSVTLIQNINLKNVTLSGDTRFDRVSEILKRDNSLKFMEQFKATEPCFVAGSTWPEDEEIIVAFVNESSKSIKYVIAPHNIKTDHIQSLKKSISKKVLLYSEIEKKDPSLYEVIIIDTIGLLTKIYSYADFTYVGGAFATGLHNTLEPAVFGAPIIIGPNYKGFNEAENLVTKKGLLVIKTLEEFTSVLNNLCENQEFSKRTGLINSSFVKENMGASIQIMAHIRRLL
ncbi:3-deoxy-D-manno-octulosonic acid transferase [Maribacter sp. HTCC2170]|uniref:3-deoxy-D-manno-octulosonic acid transferase n=1 Tax=Maribacter sp. (strain HTCC2170 / KCCM 42371) TaxID=313603 RepID=UPI00006BD30B|nr:3-deoxy-D-manno-octulosonic-acid transferase [Maribacter sp. HTCC2170]